MAARLSRHSSATLAGVLLCLALGAVPVLAQEAGAPARGGAAALRREARRERLTALPPVESGSSDMENKCAKLNHNNREFATVAKRIR